MADLSRGGFLRRALGGVAGAAAAAAKAESIGAQQEDREHDAEYAEYLRLKAERARSDSVHDGEYEWDDDGYDDDLLPHTTGESPFDPVSGMVNTHGSGFTMSCVGKAQMTHEELARLGNLTPSPAAIREADEGFCVFVDGVAAHTRSFGISCPFDGLIEGEVECSPSADIDPSSLVDIYRDGKRECAFILDGGAFGGFREVDVVRHRGPYLGSALDVVISAKFILDI